MYRVIDNRDTGKTKKLLSECAKNQGVYICKHPKAVPEKCLAYGLPFIEAYGYDEIDNAPKDKPLYIDELECFAQSYVNNLAGYALSKE